MAATLQSLRASTDRLAQLEGEVLAERERRNSQVTELVDEGTDRKLIMSAGDLSAKTICVILGKP